MDQRYISKISAAQRILSRGLILLPSENHLSHGQRKIGICSDLQGCHLDPFLQCFQVEGWAVLGPTQSLKYWFFSEELENQDKRVLIQDLVLQSRGWCVVHHFRPRMGKLFL